MTFARKRWSRVFVDRTPNIDAEAFGNHNINLGNLGASVGDTLLRSIFSIQFTLDAVDNPDPFVSGFESYVSLAAMWFLWPSPTPPSSVAVNPWGTGSAAVDELAMTVLQPGTTNYDRVGHSMSSSFVMPGGMLDVKGMRKLSPSTFLMLSLGIFDHTGLVGTNDTGARYPWGYLTTGALLVGKAA